MKQISITMDCASVSAYNRSGVQLIIWKSVGNSDAATKPLIWSVLQTISQTMYVRYTSTSISAYTSTSADVQPGTVIQPAFSAPIAIGQILVLSKNGGGSGEVQGGGPAGAVSVQNSTGTEYLCGLMQAQGSNDLAPYCAVPIYGAGQESLYPVDKVLLGFSSAALEPGEYVPFLDGSAPITSRSSVDASVGTTMLLIDLTSADTRSVSYDINTGWSWGQNAWGTAYSSDIKLAAILIEGDCGLAGTKADVVG
jgi:hypothetical protein